MKLQLFYAVRGIWVFCLVISSVAVFAQDNVKVEQSASLKKIAQHPIRIVYRSIVMSLEPKENIVGQYGSRVKVKIPNMQLNGKPTDGNIAAGVEGPAGTIKTSGSLDYEVLAFGEKVKVSIKHTDGRPLGIYSFDGQNSTVAIYPEEVEKPSVMTLPNKKFSLEFYKLKDYTNRYGFTLEEFANGLIRTGNIFVDDESTPSLKLVYGEEGQNLLQINMYSNTRATGYMFSNFENFLGAQIPHEVKYYVKNAAGLETLGITYSSIKYEELAPNKFDSLFADRSWAKGDKFPGNITSSIIKSTAEPVDIDH